MPYAQIPNAMLHDNRLSMKAKGLLSFLLSLPPDWVIYKSTLPNYFDDGYSAISSAWDELVEAGYILSVQMIGEGHKFQGWNHVVYYESYKKKPNVTTPETEETDTETSDCGKPQVGEPPTTKKQNTKKENTKKEISIVEFAVSKLNEYTKSDYRATTKGTQTKVKSLEKQGFTKEDIDLVIRFKTKEWLNNADMRQYLRPETLFAGHFESYLQAAKLAGKVEVPVQVVDVMSGDEAKAEYQRIIAKGLKVATKQELEWVYDYQHRRDDWYITQIRAEEKLINRGESRTMEDAMNYPTKTV